MRVTFARLCLILVATMSAGFFQSPVAQAADGAFFDLTVSYTAVNLAIDPRLKPDVGSTIAVGANTWHTLGDYPFGFGISTLVYLGGNFGSLPIIQTGFPLLYFPWTRPVSSYSVADDVVVHSSAWSPFLKLTPGLEFMNFRNQGYGAQFGSSSFSLIASMGIFLPSSSESHWLAEISYTSTLNATDNNSSPIAVSGILATIGYSFRF